MKPNLSRAFPPYSERERQKQLSEHRTVEKGHGRITKRHLQASSRLARHLDWPGLKQVCRIERVTKTDGQETREIVYAITSLSAQRAGADKLLQYNRGHWGIESHHWIRDVSLGEDASREKRGNIGHNLASLRNACVNLLRERNMNGIASTLRHFSWRVNELFKFLCMLKN